MRISAPFTLIRPSMAGMPSMSYRDVLAACLSRVKGALMLAQLVKKRLARSNIGQQKPALRVRS